MFSLHNLAGQSTLLPASVADQLKKQAVPLIFDAEQGHVANMELRDLVWLVRYAGYRPEQMIQYVAMLQRMLRQLCNHCETGEFLGISYEGTRPVVKCWNCAVNNDHSHELGQTPPGAVQVASLWFKKERGHP